MINLDKKQSLFKRLSLITLSVLIAVVSVFALIPKRTNKANALTVDNGTVNLNNFSISSVLLANDNYYVANLVYPSLISISISESGVLSLERNSFQVFNTPNNSILSSTVRFSLFDLVTSQFNNNTSWLKFPMIDDEITSSYKYVGEIRGSLPTQVFITSELLGEYRMHSLYTDFTVNNTSASNACVLVDTFKSSTFLNGFFYDCFRVNRYVDTEIDLGSLDKLIRMRFEYNSRSIPITLYYGAGEREVYTNYCSFIFYDKDNDFISIDMPCYLGNTSFFEDYFIVDNIVDLDSYVYQSGYDSGYNVGYSEGQTNGYNSGYILGEEYGYNNGFEKGSSINGTFLNFFTSIVDAPIMVFTQMFDFEILGVNMSEFFLSLLSLAIITIIIRWFI